MKSLWSCFWLAFVEPFWPLLERRAFFFFFFDVLKAVLQCKASLSYFQLMLLAETLYWSITFPNIFIVLGESFKILHGRQNGMRLNWEESSSYIWIQECQAFKFSLAILIFENYLVFWFKENSELPLTQIISFRSVQQI